MLSTITSYSRLALVSKTEVLLLAAQFYRVQGGITGISEKRFSRALDFMGLADRRRARHFSEYEAICLAIACAAQPLPKLVDPQGYCQAKYLGWMKAPEFAQIVPGFTSDFYVPLLTADNLSQWAKAPATLRQIIQRYTARNLSDKVTRGKEALPKLFAVGRDEPLDYIQHLQIMEICKELTADPDATLAEVFVRCCDRRRFKAAFPSLETEDAVAIGRALEFFRLPLKTPDFCRLKALYKSNAIAFHPDKSGLSLAFQANLEAFTALKERLFV
jgi:hypothetical protein